MILSNLPKYSKSLSFEQEIPSFLIPGQQRLPGDGGSDPETASYSEYYTRRLHPQFEDDDSKQNQNRVVSIEPIRRKHYLEKEAH